MSTVYLAVEVERQEGKFVSNELIGDELVGLLDGESVDVEDSTYDVVSVEVAASPKAGAKPPLDDRVLLILDEAVKAYAQAFPLRLDKDDPDPKENLTLNQAVFVHAFEALTFNEGLGEAIQKAKVRAAKKPATEAQKAINKAARERYGRTESQKNHPAGKGRS